MTDLLKDKLLQKIFAALGICCVGTALDWPIEVSRTDVEGVVRKSVLYGCGVGYHKAVCEDITMYSGDRFFIAYDGVQNKTEQSVCYTRVDRESTIGTKDFIVTELKMGGCK